MSTNAIRASWGCWLGVLAALLASPRGAKASPIEIDLSTYTLNATGYTTISIYVYASGGTVESPALQMVSGVNLEIETVPAETTNGNTATVVGTTAYQNTPQAGGPLNPGQTAPSISNVNLLASGALFAGNNSGQGGGALQQNASYVPSPTSAQESQFWSATTDTAGGLDTAAINGTPVLLATVTLDTTGVAPGTYSLVIDDPNTQQSSFPTAPTGQIFPTVIDGFLTVPGQVMPEPASIGILGMFAAGMLLLRRRRVGAASSTI